MAIIMLVIFFWAISAAVKAGKRKTRRVPATATYTTPPEISSKLAVLEAFQAQRAELNEQLDVINAVLDAAPPEKERLRWMKERTRVYGQLATCESKISRLCGN